MGAGDRCRVLWRDGSPDRGQDQRWVRALSDFRVKEPPTKKE